MKSYIKIFFLIAFVSFSFNTFAQKWKNDPTYSAHNYKHPNKAATAKKYEPQEGVQIQYLKSLTPSTNYKAQNTLVIREPQLVAVVRTTQATRSDNRNYKQQFAPRNRQ